MRYTGYYYNCVEVDNMADAYAACARNPAYREIFFQILFKKRNFYCNNTYPNDSTPNGIPFDAKSIGTV